MKLSTAYRADIDGLRAIAVLSVMLFHLKNTWLPGGFVGVDVFFVISGFVVTSSLAQSKATNAWQFITQFYARRLARIMPALLFVLLCTIVAATLFIPQAWLTDFSEETARFAFAGLSNIKLQNNVDTYFAPRTEYNPYTHTWSLGVEEQFYLIVPVLIYSWLKATRKGQERIARLAQILIATFALGSLVWCIWTTKHYPTIAFYSISTRFWELASGSALFIATCHRHRYATSLANHPHLQTLGAGAGLLLIGLGFTFANGAQFPWPWALLPVIGTILLIGSAHIDKLDPIRRALSKPSLVWIGKRSYSLYLWHWPIYVLMRWTIGLEHLWQFAIALAATVLLSMFSYRFIEQPFRHNRIIEKLPNIAIVAIFLSTTFGTYLTANHFFKNAAHYSKSVVMQNSHDWYRHGLANLPGMTTYDCMPDRQRGDIAGGHYLKLTPKKECQRQSKSINNAQEIFVIGDSHADALFPVFEELSARFAAPMYIYANAGCSFIDFHTPMDKSRSSDCNIPVFNKAVSQDVLRLAKAGDLIILPSLRMKRYNNQWASFGIKDMYDQMYNEDAKRLRTAATDDAKEWLTPFIQKKLKVVFIAPLPIFKSPAFRCADWFNRNNPICYEGVETPKAELEALRTPILGQMNTLSHEMPQVYVWDPFEWLCPGVQCRAIVNGRPLFFDGDHLSNYANYLLYPHFSQWLEQEHLLANTPVLISK